MRLFVLLLSVLSRAYAAKLELLGAAHERVTDEYLIGFHDDAESVAHFHGVVSNWTQHFSSEPELLGEALGMHLLYVSLSEDEVRHVEENIEGVDYMHHNLVAEHYQTTTQDRATPSLDRIDGSRDGRYTYRSDGEGCDVFVLDTGIQTTNRGWDGQASFLADCTVARRCLTSGANDPQDPRGHGTHVAGSVASRQFGVAKGARVRSVRVLGSNGRGSTAGIIRGINEVVRQRDQEGNQRPGVINMSLGGGRSTGFNEAVNRAVRGANGDPITIVVAAGNDNRNANNASPASATRAITVGSSQANDRRSSFSNFGAVVDIFAVGSRVQSLYPDSDGSRRLSGTSMAAPHVAGAACQLLSADPSRTPEDVANILIATAQTGRLTNLPAGTPNRLLNVADERFGAEVRETLPPPGPTLTDPPPVLVPTGTSSSERCMSTTTFNLFNNLNLERGYQSNGVMFDLHFDAADVQGGQAPTIESITVYSVSRITNGIAQVYFTADRRSYNRQNVMFNSGRWTPVTNSVGQDEVRVNSAAQSVQIRGVAMFPTVIALPEPHELSSGARQGIYVVFTSPGDRLVVDDPRRNLITETRSVLTSDGVVNLIPGRLVAGVFSNRGRSIVAPLVNLCYSTVTGNLDRVLDEPPQIEGPRLSDNLDCVQNEIVANSSDFLNNQNGVMFDLSVNELAAADLPGVFLEGFSVFLMDSSQAGVAEVWTTRNGLSYAGQELDPTLWRQIGVINGIDRELDNGRREEDGGAVIDDGSQFDNDTINVPIERPAVPELLDLNFAMNFALRTDGSKQGFYVTFQEDQMEYYADETLIESSEIASNEYVTISGGKGVRYPFAEVFDRRQFAGQACFSYKSTSDLDIGTIPENPSAASTLTFSSILGVSVFALLFTAVM